MFVELECQPTRGIQCLSLKETPFFSCSFDPHFQVIFGGEIKFSFSLLFWCLAFAMRINITYYPHTPSYDHIPPYCCGKFFMFSFSKIKKKPEFVNFLELFNSTFSFKI